MPLKNEPMSLISWVHTEADVKRADYTEGEVHVEFEAPPEFAEKVRKKVQELQGTFKANEKQEG